jgi:DNA polymerase-3 subunit delta'
MNLFEEDADQDAGAPPLPEAGDGLAEPRLMRHLYGCGQIEEMLAGLAQENRIPHAMIFSGPAGIGKATMAFRFARFLLSGSEIFDIPAENKTFRQIAALGHPDLIYIELPEGKTIMPVEEVRKVNPFLRMTSSGGGWRIAIVDDADMMNRSSQNALLKILEEPPDNALLILVAHRPGALIPTIRSRCRVINFRPLGPEDMNAVMRMSPEFAELDNTKQQSLLDIAGGSPGRALKYLESGSLEMMDALETLLGKLPVIDWIKVHYLADSLAGQKQLAAYRNFQEIMLLKMQASAKDKAISGKTGFLSDNYTLEEMSEICEKLEQHFARANTANLDKKQTVLGAFMILKSMGNR